MRKKLLGTIPFLIVAGVGLVVYGLPGESQESDQELKNVQVLKGMTKDEIQEYMSDVVDFLGVEKCTYCHVRDKSSDENEHKVIAREYIKMTKELNETVFKDKEQKITCFTCHRGEKEPINRPAEKK